MEGYTSELSAFPIEDIRAMHREAGVALEGLSRFSLRDRGDRRHLKRFIAYAGGAVQDCDLDGHPTSVVQIPVRFAVLAGELLSQASMPELPTTNPQV